MIHQTCATHRSYQLGCEEYEALLAVRPGCCHWCGVVRRKLEIDHDHALGFWAVRGLLCRACNKRIQLVEDGVHPRTTDAERYLAEAWHLRQKSSEAKRNRARPRVFCPACGLDCAAKRDGLPIVHWSRIPGRTNERCVGIIPPAE